MISRGNQMPPAWADVSMEHYACSRRRRIDFSACLVVPRRLDPASAHRIPELAKRDRLIVVLCSEGFASSLAAATLCDMGLQAVDVIDGFGGWAAAELPTRPTEFVAPGS